MPGERERVYHHVESLPRTAAEEAFAAGDPDVIIDALVACAFYEPDGEWVQAQLFRFAAHESPDVRAAAAICFGHLARIHRRLDVARAVPLLQRLRADPVAGGSAYDALTDLRQFLPASRPLIGELD